MSRIAKNVSLQHIGTHLDSTSTTPLYEQLEGQIASLIQSGTLPVGCKLPSSRDLALSLGISRNTVVKACELLILRGFLRSGRGSGTYAALPETPAPRSTPAVQFLPDSIPQPSRIEARYRDLTHALHLSLPAPPFRPNFPALDAFPLKSWGSATARLLRRLSSDQMHKMLGEGSPSGDPSLRRAVAEHLRLARGLTCSEDNVLIFAGADQALDVALRVIANPGDGILCEDPGYRGMITALSSYSNRIHPIPVDDEGFNVDLALERCPDARVAYVFPSNQFPLGVSLSLQRREALLNWAKATRSWIVEADFDSELRYAGRPLPSLHSLDTIGSVIYIGTLSKIMFPSLRIGYAVVPDSILNACIGARSVAGRLPLLDQTLAADFMESGGLARHLRKMRNLYAKRQNALLEALNRHAGELMTTHPVASGMQVLAWLHGDVSDLGVAEDCARLGLEVAPLSAFTIRAKRPPALVLGFAAFNERQLDEAAAVVASVVRKARMAGRQGGSDEAAATAPTLAASLSHHRRIG